MPALCSGSKETTLLQYHKVIVSYRTSKHVSNYYIGLPCSLVFILLIRKCECHLKPLTKSGSLQTMHLDQLCQILCHHRF